MGAGVSCHSKRFCFCPVRALISRVADRPTTTVAYFVTKHARKSSKRNNIWEQMCISIQPASPLYRSFSVAKVEIELPLSFPSPPLRQESGSPPLNPFAGLWWCFLYQPSLPSQLYIHKWQAGRGVVPCLLSTQRGRTNGLPPFPGMASAAFTTNECE